MRIKKISKIIISLCLTLLLLPSVLLPEIANAYTTHTQGDKNFPKISINNLNRETAYQLTSIRGPGVFQNTYRHELSGKIKDARQVNVYRFHVTEEGEGYYQIYTTGSLDTVGAVYNNVGKQIITNDFGYIDYKDNFSMVVYLEQNKDYYVYVRGYGKKTGNYKLIVEPNKDVTFCRTSGMWTVKDPGTSIIGRYSSKIYLDKYQTAIFYNLAHNYSTIKNKKYSCDKYKKVYDNLEELIRAKNKNDITASTLKDYLNYSFTAGGFFISGPVGNLVSAIAFLTDISITISNYSMKELCEDIEKNANISSTINKNQCEYKASNGICLTCSGSNITGCSKYDEGKNTMCGYQGAYGKWKSISF